MTETGTKWAALMNHYVNGVRPYVPGKPIAAVRRELGLEDVVKLASNENAWGPSPRALRAAKEHLGEVHRYPESMAPELRVQLAKRLKIQDDQIILGNGSNELLVLLAQAFLAEGEELIFADPSFIVYEMMAQMTGAIAVKVPLKAYTHDLSAMKAAITPRTKMICVCNPNNPTGTMVTRKELEAFLADLPPTIIVVLDEAYFEYVERADYPSGLDYVGHSQPVVTLRSFSKIYGLAGLRIGYGMSDPELVHILHRIRQPFNVNHIAIHAALAALSDAKHLAATLKATHEGRQVLLAALDEAHLTYAPPVTNFVFVDFHRSASPIVQRWLEQGVIVRQVTETGVRITVGTLEENQKLIAALHETLAIQAIRL